MSAIQQLLTEHLDIWTAADTGPKSGRGRSSANAAKVYGISKLRELILELAVRGKLVPQDASDEPASELLNRIQAEKAKLIAKGKVKKEKPLPPITENERPLDLPQSWELVRLGDIAFSQAGFAFKSNGFNESGLGLPLIRIRDVGQPFTGTYFDGEYRDEFVVRNGDYLISMDGEFRVAKWLNKNALLNQRVSRLIFFGKELAGGFVAESLQARLRGLQGVKAYTTVDHLSGGQISNSIIGLPPVQEQHRIVAKVDELMALCDQLEAEHNNASEAHEKLVSHLLGTLTQSQSAEDFSANWQRIVIHFDTLFATEASIDALKQTLLQLAVMGKLVPQNPNDEPASELLKRIQKEKANLISIGKIKKHPPVKPIGEAVALPSAWIDIAVQDFSDVRLGSTPSRSRLEYWSGDIPWVSSGEVANSIILDTNEKISKNGFDNSSVSIIPKRSLLIAIIGQGKTRGQSALLGIDACTNQNVAALVFNEDFILPEFVWLWAQSKYESHRGDGRGGAQSALNGKMVRSFRFFLPPLAEQHRIVAKVDELMALCDQLKSRLTEVSQLQQKLADILVETAVAENARQSSNRNTGK